MNDPVWWLTRDGDKTCLALYERHYSANRYADGRKRYQFVGPGEHLVLRTNTGDAMFVWRRYIDDTIPKQRGIECAVFRNEAPAKWRSSDLVRQADAIADFCWPGARHYTKVSQKDAFNSLDTDAALALPATARDITSMAQTDAPATTMSDAELGAELCPDNPAEGAIAASRLTAEKRAVYERLVTVGRELVLWEAGVGPMPEGVIVTLAGKWRR